MCLVAPLLVSKFAILHDNRLKLRGRDTRATSMPAPTWDRDRKGLPLDRLRRLFCPLAEPGNQESNETIFPIRIIEALQTS